MFHTACHSDDWDRQGKFISYGCRIISAGYKDRHHLNKTNKIDFWYCLILFIQTIPTIFNNFDTKYTKIYSSNHEYWPNHEYILSCISVSYYKTQKNVSPNVPENNVKEYYRTFKHPEKKVLPYIHYLYSRH